MTPGSATNAWAIEKLSGFVPPEVFDAHAHLAPPGGGGPALLKVLGDRQPEQTLSRLLWAQQLEEWLPAQRSGGLFFGLPKVGMDRSAANDFVRSELTGPLDRGLLLVAPQDDPVAIESQLQEGWSGFKPYHLFAESGDTYEAEIPGYLPRWMWELADRYELVIMLHLVRRQALSDLTNQVHLREKCREYPQARVVLAHAGRGFCAHHTIEAAHELQGLDNLYFDTSCICESAPLEVVLRTFGPERLLFGTDFPVSELLGRCISIGDGFLWVDNTWIDWSHHRFAAPVRLGVESLMALRQASRTVGLTDPEIELIFNRNARQLLRISGSQTSGSMPPPSCEDRRTIQQKGLA
ncbi:amidohydrolase family protein [Planctomicrobium sp. SH664]|uniref:amidohydrolase family protein n=1 Tax=Planctomicrobium sp. SH664 TaxID=3448125 RepID=UPI003F5B22C3